MATCFSSRSSTSRSSSPSLETTPTCLPPSPARSSPFARSSSTTKPARPSRGSPICPSPALCNWSSWSSLLPSSLPPSSGSSRTSSTIASAVLQSVLLHPVHLQRVLRHHHHQPLNRHLPPHPHPHQVVLLLLLLTSLLRQKKPCKPLLSASQPRSGRCHPPHPMLTRQRGVVRDPLRSPRSSGLLLPPSPSRPTPKGTLPSCSPPINPVDVSPSPLPNNVQPTSRAHPKKNVDF